MVEFRSVLIANRGEIAVRIMRTARALGLRTIAVYSEADRQALHVKSADDAVCIGAAPVGESYLKVDRIIEAARSTGAGAIHPGYGFLSENSAFAQAVVDAGLVFIGPTPHAIEIMGDKAIAKRRMLEAGVPCVPGYEGADQSDARFIESAAEIGYPVMVKASAGGGGRGMRLVSKAEGLPAALRLARSESLNAFGSEILIIEKAIVRPRHVEVQVFADHHGNVIHLGERDCSVQRRHQKVIEEAPCPVMTPELRARMGAAAVEAARAVGYQGAGTVEFLLDANLEFYFLEMNTRLQVEHPVTELITGLDLVTLQIRAAQGHPLQLRQDDIALNGHAIEVRLYAEDPTRDFLPSTGPVHLWLPPAGDGVRVDAGIESGSEVSPFYDAMVAKIIAHGGSRQEARLRLIRALEGCALYGPASNRDFLIDALKRETFAQGKATTAFIEETYGAVGYRPSAPGIEELGAAALIQQRLACMQSLAAAVSVSAELIDWSSAADLESVRQYAVNDSLLTVIVRPVSGGYDVLLEGEEVCHIEILNFAAPCCRLRINGTSIDARFHAQDQRHLYLSLAGRSFALMDLSGGSAVGEEPTGGGTVAAPMHGMLIEVLVKAGDRVSKGDKLAVLEAMKMQHEILAAIDGVVASVAGQAGKQIAADDIILEIEADKEPN